MQHCMETLRRADHGGRDWQDLKTAFRNKKAKPERGSMGPTVTYEYCEEIAYVPAKKNADDVEKDAGAVRAKIGCFEVKEVERPNCSQLERYFLGCWGPTSNTAEAQVQAYQTLHSCLVENGICGLEDVEAEIPLFEKVLWLHIAKKIRTPNPQNPWAGKREYGVKRSFLVVPGHPNRSKGVSSKQISMCKGLRTYLELRDDSVEEDVKMLLGQLVAFQASVNDSGREERLLSSIEKSSLKEEWDELLSQFTPHPDTQEKKRDMIEFKLEKAPRQQFLLQYKAANIGCKDRKQRPASAATALMNIRVDAVTKYLSLMDQEMGEIQGRVDEVEEKVQGLGDDMEEMKQEVRGELEEMKQYVRQLEALIQQALPNMSASKVAKDTQEDKKKQPALSSLDIEQLNELNEK